MYKLIILLGLFFSVTNLVLGQDYTSKTKCSIAKEGTFYFGNSKIEINILRTSSQQVDKIFYNKNTYYIYSEIKWINECEYELKMISSTMPKFKYQPNDILKVKIDSILGRDIFYTTQIHGNSWQDKMTKQK